MSKTAASAEGQNPMPSDNFNLEEFWKQESWSHLQVAQKTFDQLEIQFSNLVNKCTNAIKNGNKLLFFGNGGSAADAQHLATELTVRFIKDRPPIAALALTTDTSSLTAIGNDFGFDYLFSRQLQALGKPGDVAIGISTSGNSPNIINALKTARQGGITTVGLTGNNGGSMAEFCEIALIVPSNSTARIQEMHITLGHMLCGALETKLGLL